ncbi:metallophosphoesterase [Flavihumibacter sp. ZG627]|uniref:metallophosphoesterase n=1 Tax=Flavihumibacter sp. ZG627 TaxID=1463156 RepID=UPI0005805FD0|nr:metallophosphoesterase [Flavihumibacter sp. ZG627]KIC91434.1 DNA mismatch repair protein MutT [Flavihumibacter sp. ZG627]
MRNSGFLWLIMAILIVLDIYVFQALKVVSQSAGSRVRILIYSVYWLISLLSVLALVFMPNIQAAAISKSLKSYLFAVVVGLFFAKLIAVLFFVADDLRRGMMWMVGKLYSNPSVPLSQSADGITRSAFLSWMGLAAGSTLFGTLVYGFSNKYNYNLKKLKLSFDNLPAAFRGLKIIHISDIHAGSFNDHLAVKKGIQTILSQKADLILFTGDLVNDRAVEMDEVKHLFAELNAPLGVYSILGNHDYGDYYQWPSSEVKKDNLETLKKIHGEMGWRLLMNEYISIEKEGEKIAILGIENWSAKGNFPKYGKLSEAYKGTEEFPFKILMSHDPSHWDGEVRELYKDIDLMLSGHTHGMQFGVELPGFKWSPVQYMYRQWAGLYETERQKLYVNRGFGFIGYPGRVGILPEITLIELV